MGWLRRIFSAGPQRDAERRRYPRYPVSAEVEVDVDDRTVKCSLDNVSAGGVRLVPAIAALLGEAVTVRHPGSGLALRGQVVGQDEGGTRVRFKSEDAGIVVSSWLRLSQEGQTQEGGSR